MKNFLRTCGKLCAVIILLGITAAIILYQLEYYDFVFMPREHETATETATEESEAVTGENVTEYSDDYTVPVASGENVSLITDPKGIEGLEETTSSSKETEPPSTPAPTYSQLISKIPKADKLNAAGWSITDTDYNKSTHRIAIVAPPIKIPKVFSYRTDTVNTETFEKNEWIVSAQTVTKTVLAPYMGYILMDDGSNVTLMNSFGEPIAYEINAYKPAYMRDAYKRVLFTSYNGNYYTLSASNTMTPVEVNESFCPGLKFDYTSDYGSSKNGLRLFYVERTVSYISNQHQINRELRNFGIEIEPEYAEETVRLYGYMDAAGNHVIEPQYYYAYNFSENGLACVGDREGTMWLINRNGQTIINPYGNMLYPAERNRRPCIDGYAIPKTKGQENTGMLYSDMGLMCVRRRVIDYYDTESIVADTPVLIDSRGSEFNIPAGYTLVYYSDGVLVLTKNGYYGCMDYTGKWIAQPIYTYAGPFSEGLCVIGFSDGKKGVIDTAGNIVLPFTFDHISNMSSGVITAYEKSNGWTIFNKLAQNLQAD